MFIFPRLHILDRYILKELFNPFIFGTMGFVIIGITDLLFSLVDMFINRGVPFLVAAKLLIFKVPDILVLFLPMAALFATVISLLRLIKDSELTILRTSGYSLGRVIIPIVFFGFFVSSLALFINEFVVPRANEVSERLLTSVVYKNSAPDLIENTFFKGDSNEHFFIKKYDKDAGKMYGIAVYETTGKYPRTILAESAVWEQNRWILEKGKIFRYAEGQELQYQNSFEKMTIRMGTDIKRYFALNKKSEREMDSRQLKLKIQDAKNSGINTQKLEVALHLKRAIPFSSLIFVLFGTAIIIVLVKGREDLWGMVFSILLSLLSVGFYFFVMATFRALGRNGVIEAIGGAWAPNVIFGLFAAFLLIREHFVK